MRAFIPILLLVACATAQSTPPNRLTFSGGWSRQLGDNFGENQTAPGLGLSYGYRIHRFVEAETGIFTALDPTRLICYRTSCEVADRLIWIPFGARFIAPLRQGRAEVSGGGGGLYKKYTTVASLQVGSDSLRRHEWGGYIVGSAAIALDRSRHFWLGVTPRWFLASPPFYRDRWFQICGEFSVRF